METLSSPTKASSKTITTHSRVMLSLLMFAAVKAATCTMLKTSSALCKVQAGTASPCLHPQGNSALNTSSLPPQRHQVVHSELASAPCTSRKPAEPAHLAHPDTALSAFRGKHPRTPAPHFNTISFTFGMPLPKLHRNLFRAHYFFQFP